MTQGRAVAPTNGAEKPSVYSIQMKQHDLIEQLEAQMLAIASFVDVTTANGYNDSNEGIQDMLSAVVADARRLDHLVQLAATIRVSLKGE